MKEDALMKVAHLLCEYANKEKQHIFLPVESWRPGLIVTVNAPVVTEDDLAASDMLVLEDSGRNIWICAKMSPEINPCGAWDYILDGTRWGSFSARVELDNTLGIHASDLGNQAYAVIPADILAEILKIFHAYETGAPAPQLPLNCAGDTEEEREVYQYTLEEFKSVEEDFMNRLRLHLHEGWTPEEKRVPLTYDGQVPNVVIPFTQARPLFSLSRDIYEYAPAASSSKINLGGASLPVHAVLDLTNGNCTVENSGKENFILMFYAVGERGEDIIMHQDCNEAFTTLPPHKRMDIYLALPKNDYTKIVVKAFPADMQRG